MGYAVPVGGFYFIYNGGRGVPLPLRLAHWGDASLFSLREICSPQGVVCLGEYPDNKKAAHRRLFR